MSFYEILVVISLVLWILISGGLIVALIVFAPRLARTLHSIEEHRDLFVQRVLPLVERSDHVLDQTSQITSALVADVELVDRTVIRATDSVERMIELAEERVSELNALLEVAVEEAEETFFSTAALLRALRIGGKKRRRKLLGGERRRFG